MTNLFPLVASLDPWLLVLHAASTFALVGLIWTVQLVHYPLFDEVDPSRYARFQRRHMSRVTPVVGVLMPLEAVTALGLALTLPAPLGASQAWVGVALVGLVWLSTALVQAPLHARLLESFDAGLHRRLVRTNWIRTLLWSARGFLVATWLLRALG